MSLVHGFDCFEKSEELRAHIKRLDSDLRNLERSKMENSGNLQIKAQELQQMSEYVKKLETSEHELRQRLEAYQKSTVNESEKYQSRIRELELNTKKMSDMKQTERVLRRHIIEIDKARASEARQHHRAKLQLEEMEKKMSSCAVLMERAKEVEPLVQEVTMLKASESRLKEQLKSISEGNNVSDSIITESQSKDDELHKLYDQIKSLNKKMEDSSTMIEENESLKKKITEIEAKFKESRISLEAQLARQDIAVSDKTKQVTESLALIARLQKQVAAPADSTTKRNLLEKIVALEEEAMKAKSESSRLQTVVEQNIKMTVPCSSVELSDGTYSAAQSDLHTKVSEQGEELQTLHKTLLAINKGRMKAIKKRDADQDDDDNNVISLQNIDSLNFIIKENMTLGDLMQNLNDIYERDMSKLNDEKKAALQAVEDMKSTMLESKLSEVENEFSNYPAALSLELRNLNNKLALSEDSRRNLNVEIKLLKDQITNKSSEGILMQTRLNDAERQLHNASDGRQQRQSQADKDQAEGRHKSVKHKLQAEIELLESSLETAHGTIKALQTQVPGSPDNSNMIKKVQETHTQINQMKAQYRNQISELEQTLANQSADMMKRDKDIKLLNEQINQLQSRMGRVSGSKDQDILALTQERDLHIATKIRLEQQNTELVMLCENIKGDFEKQTYTLTDLKKSRDNVQHELEGKELEIQNLNTKVHAYEEKITSLRTQLSSTTSPDNLLQSKEEQICDLEEKLNNTSEKSQAEISRIKADLWKVQTDLTTERAAKVSAEASVAELRLKYDNCNSSYQRELESSQSQLSTTKAQLMSLTDQHDMLTTRTDQLQKQVKELEYDIESKTRELREVKSRTSELDKTVKQRNEEIGNLMKKTAAMEKEVSMRRNASDVNSELSDLLLNKDNHINSLEERLKSTKEDILESKAQVSKLQEQLKRSQEERQKMSQEARQLQNSVTADNNAEREALQQRNEDLNKEISRLASNLTQAEKGGDEALIARVREADAERVMLTESLQRSTESLDTKDRELSAQKSEIQTLKATLDGHSNRLHEQASVIDRLQAELTDVKGTMAGSLLDDIQNATHHSIPRVTLEPSDSIELADDDVSDALRTIDEANMAALGAARITRSVTADSEAKYYVALFDYAPVGDYGELALKEGDMVIVLGDENNGHYLAEVGGKKGLVPTNYVEEYSAKRPGSAFPLEAYKQSAVVLDDLVDLPSPPLTPSAEWLPNSSVCISWVPPVISGGKSRGVDVAGYKVYQRGMEKTIVFGAENTEIILENMSTTSLGEFEIVTLGRGSEESIRIPISIPRPPQKAEVLKVVQGQSTGQSMDVGSTYVLALYDYTPHEQSPNEFPELELPFKEGDLLKVLGDKMDDGFFEGELNGVTGLVPSNFVQSVLDGTNGTFESDEAERRNFVALYDYNPFEMSPNENPESELTFYEGDIIIILGGMDQDGFYPGELNGIQGLVPSNFVEEAKPARNGRNYLSLPREDSTEAAIAQLLSEAASNVHNDPVKNNVPSSAETDVRTGLSVRWQGRY